MTIEEKIKNCLAKHPEWEDVRISRAVSGSRKADVTAIRAGDSISARVSTVKLGLSGSETPAGTISIAKVMAKYDIRVAILREISQMAEDTLMVEKEMCSRTAGQDKNRFRRTVENHESEFKPLRVKLKLDESGDGKWYWGRPNAVAEALKIRDL